MPTKKAKRGRPATGNFNFFVRLPRDLKAALEAEASRRMLPSANMAAAIIVMEYFVKQKEEK